MTPVPDSTDRTQEQQRRCCDDNIPPEHRVDVHSLAEMLTQDDYDRALERGLIKAGAQWNLNL